MTKVALFPGKSVVFFKDEDEKISLKLTELATDGEKTVEQQSDPIGPPIRPAAVHG